MKVSFDFDSTIALHKWDKENNDFERDDSGNMTEYINPKIVNAIKEHKAKGDTVYVVTTRYVIWHDDTKKFLTEHGLLPYIDDIFFTNGAWKANKLKKLGVELHYDDDPGELRRLKYKGIKGKIVNDDISQSYEKMNTGK